MYARRCDRCKRFYLESDYVDKRPSYAGLRLFNIRTLGCDGTRLTTYDVCPECANAFMFWIKMGECDSEVVDARCSNPEADKEVSNGTN